MNHGSQQYFLERSRFARRVSATTVVVATLALSILLITERTALRHELNVPEHFGFEGREQYSHRLELEAYGPQRDSPDAPYGVNYAPHSNRGGGTGRRAEHLRKVAAQLAPGALGPGTEPEDLLARALRRSSNVPLLQSEQLVFVRLVRPEYPEEARRRNIEGRFAVLALIDTAGRVVEVQVQGGDPTGLLEREATAAVLQCVIRPYRVDGTAQEIVARFPFNFYLRD